MKADLINSENREIVRVGVLGLGYIGYPIANLMHSLGHEVHSWTRTARNVPWENSLELFSAEKIKFDFVFIASGTTKPNFGDFKTEAASTCDLLSHFDFVEQTRFIYISSGSVYGECDVPMSEDTHPNPSTAYGTAKLLTEKKLESLFGNQLTVLRVGNLIDENNPYGIVSNLTKSIQGGIFEAFGQPTDCRDYLSIKDFLCCIQILTENKNFPNILNIGSGRSISLDVIIQILESALGDRIKILWAERRIGDIAQTKLDVSLMREHLQKTQQDPIAKIKSIVSKMT